MKKFTFVLICLILLASSSPVAPISASSHLGGIDNSSYANAVPIPTGLIKISPDNNPLPAFKWDTVAGSVSYEVKIDAGSYSNVGNKLTFVQSSILAKGIHTICVHAKDSIGNVGPDSMLNFSVTVVPDIANTKIAYIASPSTGEACPKEEKLPKLLAVVS
jgi:hypothetical protein